MTQRHLMTDVNLSDISFEGSMGGVALEFLNMSDGGRVGILYCKRLVAFIYKDYSDSTLPVYVGDVTEEVMSGSSADNLLQKLGFVPNRLSELTSVYHVRLEGELVIHVVCHELEFDTD